MMALAACVVLCAVMPTHDANSIVPEAGLVEAQGSTSLGLAPIECKLRQVSLAFANRYLVGALCARPAGMAAGRGHCGTQARWLAVRRVCRWPYTARLGPCHW